MISRWFKQSREPATLRRRRQLLILVVLLVLLGLAALGGMGRGHQEKMLAAGVTITGKTETGGAPAYRIVIPNAGVNAAVTEGIENANLASGPGHYPKTVLPGELGNAAISGHRTQRGAPSVFYGLHQLKEGDPIQIIYSDQILTFAVERVFITAANDLTVIAPTTYPALTLTTCDPPGTDENRLIVRARLDGVRKTP